MTLVKNGQDRIAQRFNRGDDEETSESTKLPEGGTMLQDMLDLRGDVKGELRKFLMHRPQDL